MTAFQPVLLGSETCAYAMARAFHSAYGLKSLVYGRMQLSVTKFSSIMEPTFFADFTEPESFRRTWSRPVAAHVRATRHHVPAHRVR